MSDKIAWNAAPREQLRDIFMKNLMFAAAGLLALVTSASAADMASPTYVKTAPTVTAMPLAYDWSGFFAGVNGGYAWSRTSVNSVPNSSFVTDFPAPSAFIIANQPRGLDRNGFTGGGQLGYNAQLGSIVYGVEADINYPDLRRSYAYGAGNIVSPAVTGSLNTDWLATFRARVGIVANNVLFYATGGAAVTEINYTNNTAVTGPATFNTSVRDTRGGWTAGGGVEWGLSANWTAKAEYLYADFHGVGAVGNRVSAIPPLTPNQAITNSTGDLSLSFVRVGLNYRWGGAPVARY